MSEKTKVNFIFKDKKSEFEFNKDDLISNILSSFANKINRDINDFNYLYNGEKIINYEYKKLSELNDTDDIINISVYEKNDLNENSIENEKNIQESVKLKISDHIICPRCKKMSEIDINNFKICIKNCDNNHSMPGLYLNDFINTQYIDESRIICHECKKSEKELISPNKKDSLKLLQCSCGIIICQSCFPKHKETQEKQENGGKKHYSVEYQDKDYFCFEHNTMFIAFCHKCKKNICNKCEGEHNKHRIEIYKKISPNEAFIQKIKIMNEEFVKKVKKFNNELNELIILINNISNNIQNDLKIFLQISNKIINDYNLTKKNYQTISNVKVIFNNMSDSQIFKYVDSFLSDSNSNSRIKIILDIYNKMYIESYNNLFEEKEFQPENQNKININEKSKDERKNQEVKKENKDNKDNKENNIILEKSNTNSYMVLKYSPNLKKIKDNKIKIFGKKFYENNRYNCSMVIKNKEYPISEYYTKNKNDLNKDDELELRLNQIKAMSDMSNMFHSEATEPSIYLSEIISINNWDISKVSDMSNLFSNCTLLKSIPDISNWDISNVENISNLFYHCINLVSIPDISKWKIDNVRNMSYLFYDCKGIVSLPDISNWNTKKVSDMRSIFCKCSSLKALPDISKWSTENVVNMSGMFQHCASLSSLPDISGWNVGNVVNMGGMFDHCITLKNLPDISKWDMKNVTNLNYMFYYCTDISSFPDISQWNTGNAKNMKGLFCDCTSMSMMPDISKWNTSNVTNMSFMFYNCKSLLSLPDLMQWDISKVEDMKSMFNNCQKLPQKVIPKKFKI